MNRLNFAAATFLGIAACATSGPESPEPGANAGISVPNGNSTATTGEVEVVDIPEVPISKNIPIRLPDIICHKEQRPGSKITKRVCHTRAEIEAARMAGQDTLRGLGHPTISGPSRNVSNASR